MLSSAVLIGKGSFSYQTCHHMLITVQAYDFKPGHLTGVAIKSDVGFASVL
jgi:hypothetical protein